MRLGCARCELADRAAHLALDPAPRVVFQAALSLGTLPGDRLAALAAIARAHAEDRWFRAALLTSRAGSSPELLAAAGGGLVAGGASADEAAQKVLDDVDPADDAVASAWYRRRVLPRLVERTLDDLEGAR